MRPLYCVLVLALLTCAYATKVGDGDCREECLDDFGSDMDECVVLPPDEQPECMEEAAEALVSCLDHCTNRTEALLMSNRRYAAMDIFVRACNLTQSLDRGALCLRSYWAQPTEQRNFGLCVGDFHSCRPIHERLAWIHLPDSNYKLAVAGHGRDEQEWSTDSSGAGGDPEGWRRVCVHPGSGRAWVASGACGGADQNFLCGHVCNLTHTVCQQGAATDTNGLTAPPDDAFCAAVDDSTLFHLLDIILPDHKLLIL